MSTSPLQQIPSTAIDAAGLSVTTAIRSATDPRPGAIYDPTHFAAAVPVHFHPTTSPSLGGTNFLMINSQHWTAATVSATHPGAYTGFTPVSTPSWVQVNAATGVRSSINGSFSIPMKTPGTATLTAAVSRGNNMLWLLNSVAASAPVAVVQHVHANPILNVIGVNGEEVIPNASNGSDSITFSAGLQWSRTTTPYMLAYGIGSVTGQVYAARKTWARVGYVGTPLHPQDSQWEVYTGSGWSTDTTTAGPVTSTIGPLHSLGPLSFGQVALHRTQRGVGNGLTAHNFVAVVTASGPQMSAQVYSALGGRPWQPAGDLIPLGSTANGSYVGATLQFHGAVGPNPAMVDGVNSSNAIPYSVTTMAASGGASSLTTDWGLLQVGRFS
jgi:hypothetical protein